MPGFLRIDFLEQVHFFCECHSKFRVYSNRENLPRGGQLCFSTTQQNPSNTCLKFDTDLCGRNRATSPLISALSNTATISDHKHSTQRLNESCCKRRV